MDYFFRFNFGLTICLVCVFWSLLKEVSGQQLVERGFGTRNSNDKNLNNFQYDILNNERLVEKTPIDEPYHEVYTLEDNSGGIQRIHYAVDNQGLRVNLNSNNVHFDPMIDSQDLHFGTRLTTKTQREQEQTSNSFPNDPPLIEIKKFKDVESDLILNVPTSERISENEFVKFPKDLNLKRIPEVVSNTNYYPPLNFPPKIDPSNLVHMIPVNEIYDESLRDDTVNKPDYDLYKESLIPIEFLREKPLVEHKPSLILPRQFPNVPESESLPVIITSMVRENPPVTPKNASQALHPKNIFTPLFIKPTNSVKSTQGELKSNTNVNINPSLKSVSKTTEYSKNANKNNALPYKAFKSTPESFISRIKYPISTIFDTSNENGQYYHYAMNLGYAPGVSSQHASKIYSTGDGLLKILNQTNIPYFKIANEVIPFNGSKMILPTTNTISINSSNYIFKNSDSVDFNLLKNVISDEFKSKQSLDMENTILKGDEKNGNNVSSKTAEEIIDVFIPKKSFDPEPNNISSDYFTTPSLIEDIFDLDENDFSEINSSKGMFESLYSTPTVADENNLPPYVTISEEPLNLFSYSKLSNISAALNDHVLSKQLIDDYEGDLEDLTAILDSSTANQNFASTTSILNTKDTLETATDHGLISSNVSLENLTIQRISETRNMMEELATVTETAVTNHDFKETTLFSAVENISQMITEPATTPLNESRTFISKSSETNDNTNQLKENKSSTEKNYGNPNSQINAYEPNAPFTISTNASDFNTEVTKFTDDSTAATMMVDFSTLTVTESSIENNTVVSETTTMIPSRKSFTSNSIETNSTKKADTIIPLSNNESVQKPVFELVIQNTEMDEIVSRLNNMPMIIRVMNPQMNASLPISNKKDAKINIEIVNSKIDKLNSVEKNNETIVPSPKEELLIRESNPKLDIVPSYLRKKSSGSKFESMSITKSSKPDVDQKSEHKLKIQDRKAAIQKGRNKILKITKSSKENGNLKPLNKEESRLMNSSMSKLKPIKSLVLKKMTAPTTSTNSGRKPKDAALKVNDAFFTGSKPINISENRYSLLLENSDKFVSSKLPNTYDTPKQLKENKNVITPVYQEANPAGNEAVLIDGYPETIGELVPLGETISSSVPLISDYYEPQKTSKMNGRQNKFMYKDDTNQYQSKFITDQKELFSSFGKRQRVPTELMAINSPNAQLPFEYVDVFPYNEFNQGIVNDHFRDPAEGEFPEDVFIILEDYEDILRERDNKHAFLKENKFKLAPSDGKMMRTENNIPIPMSFINLDK